MRSFKKMALVLCLIPLIGCGNPASPTVASSVTPTISSSSSSTSVITPTPSASSPTPTPSETPTPEVSSSPSDSATEVPSAESTKPSESTQDNRVPETTAQPSKQSQGATGATSQPAPTKAPATTQAPALDNCPNGDYSGNRYDGSCGTPPAPTAYNITVNLAGDQSTIDSCRGPVLWRGVLIAEHDYCGGSAWYSLGVGSRVHLSGSAVRNGDYVVINVDESYGGAMYTMKSNYYTLQTCIDNYNHVRLWALVPAQ